MGSGPEPEIPAKNLPRGFSCAARRYAEDRRQFGDSTDERSASTPAEVELRVPVHDERVVRQEAAAARDDFRDEVRRIVHTLRGEGETFRDTLRVIHAYMTSLCDAGITPDDNGTLEAEVMEWAIEEYHTS